LGIAAGLDGLIPPVVGPPGLAAGLDVLVAAGRYGGKGGAAVAAGDVLDAPAADMGRRIEAARIGISSTARVNVRVKRDGSPVVIRDASRGDDLNAARIDPGIIVKAAIKHFFRTIDHRTVSRATGVDVLGASSVNGRVIREAAGGDDLNPARKDPGITVIACIQFLRTIDQRTDSRATGDDLGASIVNGCVFGGNPLRYDE